MTRALPRAHLHSSRLWRFLTENGMASPAVAADDVGQKLGDWLDFRQAIALHGILNPESPPPATRPKARATVTPEALRLHVDKVRASLEASINQGAGAGSGLARIDMPPPVLDEPIDPKRAFEPWRRFIASHQRQMDTVVRTLRSQVRSQLAQGTAAQQQLATLDTAFENILVEREARLLYTVSQMLEKRFAQALKHHLKQQAEAAASQTPAPAAAPWLTALNHDVRSALLAELDTRLQPTLGLLEAFTQESSPSV
ncbi:MAG: DUF3348 family protein [Limnohabitans sp.]|nr:DUF3348 family protein [Limnohabitans sp.]